MLISGTISTLSPDEGARIVFNSTSVEGESVGLGIQEIIGDKRDAVLAIAEQHGAKNIRVFGSVARGEARPDSDIDLLMDLAPIRSEWFPIGLIQDWEDLLGRKVEVTTEKGLHPLIRDRVIREAVPL